MKVSACFFLILVPFFGLFPFVSAEEDPVEFSSLVLPEDDVSPDGWDKTSADESYEADVDEMWYWDDDTSSRDDLWLEELNQPW